MTVLSSSSSTVLSAIRLHFSTPILWLLPSPQAFPKVYVTPLRIATNLYIGNSSQVNLKQLKFISIILSQQVPRIIPSSFLCMRLPSLIQRIRNSQWWYPQSYPSVYCLLHVTSNYSWRKSRNFLNLCLAWTRRNLTTLSNMTDLPVLFYRNRLNWLQSDNQIRLYLRQNQIQEFATSRELPKPMFPSPGLFIPIYSIQTHVTTL